MIDLDDYKILFSNKKIKIVYLWLFITIFIITSVIIIIKNNDYVDYYQNEGIGTEEGYIKAIVNVKDIEKLVTKQNIIIDKKNYNYKIINFSEEINKLEGNFYQEITIEINKKIPANRHLSFKVPIDKYNLFNYIKNKIRGNI